MLGKTPPLTHCHRLFSGGYERWRLHFWMLQTLDASWLDALIVSVFWEIMNIGGSSFGRCKHWTFRRLMF